MLQLPKVRETTTVAAIRALAKQIALSLGAIWTSENRLPVDTGGSANTVTIQDSTTPGNKIKVNGTGEIFVANQPTNSATESTLAGVKTSIETCIGGTTDAPATDHNSDSALSGIIRLLAKYIFDGTSTPSTSGSIKQQLRFIGENSGGGTQYDSGNNPTTPRGNLFLGRRSTGEIFPVELDSNGYLKIAIVSGNNPPPTEYLEGSSPSTLSGAVLLAKEADGTLASLKLDNAGALQISAQSAIPITASSPLSVNIVSGGSGGGSGGVQYIDGATNAIPTGTVALANKSGVTKALQLDTNNYLQVAAPDLTNIQYVFGTTNSAPTGNVVFGSKSGVLKPFLLDANENLKVVDGDSIAQIQVIQDKLGTVGAAANPNGTTTQQLRYIAEKIDRIPIVTAISITAGVGDVTVLGSVTSQRIAITGLYFTLSNGAIIFKDGSTVLTGALTVNEHAADYTHPLVLTTGTPFVVNLSLTANVYGYVLWYLI